MLNLRHVTLTPYKVFVIVLVLTLGEANLDLDANLVKCSLSDAYISEF